MMTISELIQAIFEDRYYPLTRPFESWVKDSRRFRTFAETYRGKIRKKIRVAQDAEQIASLRLELEVARWLVEDQRCAVEYEKLATNGGRSPDFTVAFRTNTHFNVEATRIRTTEADHAEGALQPKIISTIFDKVGQMQSGMVNLLVIGCDLPIPEADLLTATKALRLAAESKQESFFTARGFQSAADFLKQFQRLGAILIWNDRLLWQNNLARHPLPKEIASFLQKP